MIFHRTRGTPPTGPVKLNRSSPHARGAVIVVPFLHGEPPQNIVDGEVYSWYASSGAYDVAPSVEGVPIRAKTLNGNSAQYIDTGRTYGLTNPSAITIDWWMNERGSYLGEDSIRSVASNRSAGNQGWSCGRSAAAAGPPGNNTALHYTVQGVAQYDSSYSVPARKWVHCCCVLSGTSLKQYADGVEVGSHTIGTPAAGTNILLLASGPNTLGYLPFQNEIHSLVVRNVALSQKEVAARANPVLTWDLYQPTKRRTFFIPAAAAPGGSGFRGLTLLGVGA